MKKEYIFAGFGGQGMLLIGKFLAMACMLDGKHVSWLPSYGPEMRGGTANCSVIVSDDPVASPLVDMADCVVAMNRPSLDKFESHVKPGGVLVINSSITNYIPGLIDEITSGIQNRLRWYLHVLPAHLQDVSVLMGGISLCSRNFLGISTFKLLDL